MAVGLISTAFAILGCGDSSDIERQDLSGQATFGGKPITYGAIQFVPDTARQHEGPAGSATIVNGAYDTAAGGSGVLPGPHLVRITAYDAPPGPGSEDELNPTEGPPPLFTGYTIEADVQGPTQDFDVPESARGFDVFQAPGRGQELDAP